MKQRTEEWFSARCGSVGGSEIADVMARTKSGYGASRKNLMAKKVVERLTGQPSESFTSAAMQFGIDNEDDARKAYEFDSGDVVTETGLHKHPTIAGTHSSPDGLIGDDGVAEIKVPNTAQHIDLLLTGQVDQRYIYQCQWHMACTGRKYCIYINYDPRLPLSMQLFVKRIERDDALIAQMEDEVIKFIYELEQTIAQLEEI